MKSQPIAQPNGNPLIHIQQQTSDGSKQVTEVIENHVKNAQHKTLSKKEKKEDI